MRQPDIEIYLRDDHLPELLEWLQQEYGPVHLDNAKGSLQHGRLESDRLIPLLVVHRAAGRWSSICFDSPDSPWATDIDCAQSVSNALKREVRCSVGGWAEGDDDTEVDRWLKVNADGVTPFIWSQ